MVHSHTSNKQMVHSFPLSSLLLLLMDKKVQVFRAFGRPNKSFGGFIIFDKIARERKGKKEGKNRRKK